MDLVSTLPPSYSFVKSQLKNKKRKLFQNWKSALPDNHVYTFIENGVLPFLKNHGYSISIPIKLLTKYLESWAFYHSYLYQHPNQKLELQYVQWFHDGGDEEYNWYCEMISESDWFELADQWQVFEFLDDSDVGNLQRCDLSWCIWHCIHLEISRSHKRWVQIVLDSEDQEEELHGIQMNEQQAYGGDRRTYS